MKYVILLLFLFLPLLVVYYSYKFIDHKNREPKRAIFFALVFSTFIFFIEFFLVKPSIGKVLSFYDTYLFVYFLTEEKEQLLALSLSQNILIAVLSCASKSITYAIGLKMLFVYLYKLGKSKNFAKKHQSIYGFLDEPIDYALYSIIFFSTISLLDSLVHYRFDSTFTTDKLAILFIMLIYICIGFIISTLWLKLKISFKSTYTNVFIIDDFATKLNPSSNRFCFKLFSQIELWSMLMIFCFLLLAKFTLIYDSIFFIVFSICASFLFMIFLFNQVKEINTKDYSIIE